MKNIEAILAIVAATITIVSFIPKVSQWYRLTLRIGKTRIFISMPMSNLDERQYTDLRLFIMNVKQELLNRNKKLAIYFENEKYPTKQDYIRGAQQLNIRLYLRQIKRSDYFVAMIPHNGISSIYYEAGYAESNCKKSLFAIFNTDYLPGLMILKSNSPNVHAISTDFSSVRNLADSIVQTIINN